MKLGTREVGSLMEMNKSTILSTIKRQLISSFLSAFFSFLLLISLVTVNKQCFKSVGPMVHTICDTMQNSSCGHDFDALSEIVRSLN